MKRSFLLGFFSLTLLRLVAQPSLQPIDASSEISFSVKNFGINTTGRLSGLKGSIRFEPNSLATAFVDVTVNAVSIDTDNERRDKHLQGSSYFNVSKYPTLRISGKPTLTPTGYVLNAQLTIKGITRSLLIPFSAVEQQEGWLFIAAFEINRLQFNVGDQSMVLADKVKVALRIFAK